MASNKKKAKAADKARNRAKKDATKAKKKAQKAADKAKSLAKKAKKKAGKAKVTAKNSGKKRGKKAKELVAPLPPRTSPSSAAPSLNDTVAVLRTRARELGISGYSRLTKAELVERISAEN